MFLNLFSSKISVNVWQNPFICSMTRDPGFDIFILNLTAHVYYSIFFKNINPICYHLFIYLFFVEQVYKKLLGDIINMISSIFCCTRAVVEATTEVTIDNLIQQEL